MSAMEYFSFFKTLYAYMCFYILRDAVILSFAGEGTSVYAGLIIYTVLGFMSTKFSVPLKDVVKPGK